MSAVEAEGLIRKDYGRKIRSIRITPEQYKEITGDPYVADAPPSEGPSGATDGFTGTE
ncbi:XkdX family protein [Bacillus subtilis]|uniref:XkdX family protein n=1 Tax=Bacillus subtilis TaxID=1423 RepID=UPI00214A24CC|nr:XkdX family protein [Bacillus subtilis]MCR1994594.1 XkdX family protein [Bacillus subtilis]